MKTYCPHCRQETETHFNDFMVQFCATCKRMRDEPANYFEPQAFICLYCERGFDEAYPGQRVCKDCTHGLSRGDWE